MADLSLQSFKIKDAKTSLGSALTTSILPGLSQAHMLLLLILWVYFLPHRQCEQSHLAVWLHCLSAATFSSLAQWAAITALHLPQPSCPPPSPTHPNNTSNVLGENEVPESERIYPRPSLRYNSGLLSPDLSAAWCCLSYQHNIPMLFSEI